MELLFVILIAFAIGLAWHYALPGRDTYGSMLLPSVTAAIAAVLWEILLWAGWKFDGGWIWVVSLVVSGLAALAIALVLPRNRRAGDENLLRSLSKA
jgi:quaternary ammonium compound-resistance protein SugE